MRSIVWRHSTSRATVRVGILRVELWRAHGAGVLRTTLQQPWAVDIGNPLRALTAALEVVLAAAKAAGARSIDLVVESALLPVMLIDTGKPWLGRRQLEILARHRFAQLYDDRGLAGDPDTLIDATAAWSLRVSHRPGDGVALACGLPGRLRHILDHTAAAAGLTVAGMQPALAWGWQALARRRRDCGLDASAVLGWIWCEQDRSIIACWRRDTLVTLNTGADLPSDLIACEALLDTESLRRGLDAPDQAAVAGWQPLSAASSSPRLRALWLAVAAPATSPEPAEAVAT